MTDHLPPVTFEVRAQLLTSLMGQLSIGAGRQDSLEHAHRGGNGSGNESDLRRHGHYVDRYIQWYTC